MIGISIDFGLAILALMVALLAFNKANETNDLVNKWLKERDDASYN